LGLVLKDALQPDELETTRREAVDYIRRHTRADEYVLLWGADVGVNWASERRSPSRFAYQIPLYQPGYQSPALVAEFLNDIETRPPVLIVDTASTYGLPPIHPADRREWRGRSDRSRVLPEMQAVLDYICRHYAAAGTVGPDNWPLYEAAEAGRAAGKGACE
jgi:hypothetical protein